MSGAIRRKIAKPGHCEIAVNYWDLASGGQGGVFIATSSRRTYKEDNFRHVFADIHKKAGLPDHLWFMDLRRAAVQHLGRGGATVSQIAHITGPSETTVANLLRRYMRRDSQVADAGIEKLELYRERTKSAPESETGSLG